VKKFGIALVVAILIAGQLFSMVAAAAPSTKVESVSWGCGGRYVVQYGDYLVRIAQFCGTTVGNILAMNPQIYNPHWIYAGMVLNLGGGGGYNYAPPPVYQQPKPAVYYNPNTYYGGYYYPGKYWTGGYYNTGYKGTPYAYNFYNAQVRVSRTWVHAGDSVTVWVSGFPANTDIDYRVGATGANYTNVYDGKTDSNGCTSATVTISSSANKGEYWIVHVLTTEGKNDVQAYSPEIYIGG
jgi:hypothetical protein